MTGVSFDISDTFKDIKRIDGVDRVHERMSELLSDRTELRAVHLGRASDDTPIFMIGAGDGDRVALVVAGSPGDNVISPSVALQLLRAADQRAGWTTWVICALDIPRLRTNETTLHPKQDLAAHVAARRSAHEPGEDPQTNLPIDLEPLWQPDEAPETAPEQFVASTAEALALARAITHLAPDLVVSLHDVLAGGVTVSGSQDLDEQDIEALMNAAGAAGLPVHTGSKVRSGRSSAAHPGYLVLPSVEEELRRLDTADSDIRLTGGVTSWQLLTHVNPDGLYVAADVPRFTCPAFADEQPVDVRRNVSVSVTERDRGGKPALMKVIKLDWPGHPADGAELRCEEVKSEAEVPCGEHGDVLAAAGWLAVEAVLTRRDVLRRAYDLFEQALPSFQHAGYVRSMQVLRDAAVIPDGVMRAYQYNKRYGRQATQADVASWMSMHPVGTAAILSEARHGLRDEDERDQVIERTVQQLDELISEQLACGKPLRATATHKQAQTFEAVFTAAVAICQRGTPAVRAASERAQRAARQLKDARRQVRDLKNMRAPRSDQEQAQQAAEQAEEALAAAQAHLQALEDQMHATADAGGDITPAEEATTAEGDTTPEGESGPEDERPDADDEQPKMDVPLNETAPTPAQDFTFEDPVERDVISTAEPEAAQDTTVDIAEEASSVEPPAEFHSPSGDVADAPAELHSASGDVPDAPAEPAETIAPQTNEADGHPAEIAPADDVSAFTPADSKPDHAEHTFDAPEVDVETDEPDPLEPGDEQTPAITLPLDQQPDPEPETGIDLDAALPQKLQLPAEWDRAGSMNWDRQIPDPDAAAPYEQIVRDLIGNGEPSERSEPPAAELQPVPETRTTDMVISDRPVEDVGSLIGTPVGFLRRRVELDAVTVPPAPRLKPPPPTGGHFRRRGRGL